MSEEVAVYEAGLPILADDTLIQIAKQAEARIDAVIKIKQMALKVTNLSDWVDQNGKPYLQASGSEKIANLFNISWKIDEPMLEQEPDGTLTYVYKGEFSLAGRSIEVEGSRSSRDAFFKKYEYEMKDGKSVKIGEKPLDRRDLKMAAMTNLLGNGITRLLGIRNLTYNDLELFAGIKREQIGKVEYKKAGEKRDYQQPQSKSSQAKEEKDLRVEISRMIKEMDITGTESELMLKTYSGFTGKNSAGEEKFIEGKTDVNQLSDAAVKVTYGKIKKAYETWKAGQNNA
jgi:hypothetical protein